MIKILDKNLLKNANGNYEKVSNPTKAEALYNARYIKLWSIIKKYYFTKLIPFTNITIGRVLIIIFRLLGLTKKQASSQNLSTNAGVIKKMSEIQMLLLLNQLKKLKRINEHRKVIVDLYNKALNNDFKFNSNTNLLLRYPVLLSNREEIKKRLLDEETIVGNWYSSPVHPLKNKLNRVGYDEASCINARKAGENILNLPTSINTSRSDAIKIAKIINNFAKPINI